MYTTIATFFLCLLNNQATIKGIGHINVKYYHGYDFV